LRQSKHELSKIDFEILFTNKTPSDCQPALVEQKKRPRVNAGLKRAVEAGKTLGRPRISVAVEKRIQTQLRADAILQATQLRGVAIRCRAPRRGWIPDASLRQQFGTPRNFEEKNFQGTRGTLQGNLQGSQGQFHIQGNQGNALQGNQSRGGNPKFNTNANINSNTRVNTNANVNTNRHVNTNANVNINRNLNVNQNQNQNRNVNRNANVNRNFNGGGNQNRGGNNFIRNAGPPGGGGGGKGGPGGRGGRNDEHGHH
jgi:hypothetical protein